GGGLGREIDAVFIAAELGNDLHPAIGGSGWIGAIEVHDFAGQGTSCLVGEAGLFGPAGDGTVYRYRGGRGSAGCIHRVIGGGRGGDHGVGPVLAELNHVFHRIGDLVGVVGDGRQLRIGGGRVGDLVGCRDRVTTAATPTATTGGQGQYG